VLAVDALDYETQSRYYVVVTVQDNDLPVLLDMMGIEIAINDVNGVPVLPNSIPTLCIDENSADLLQDYRNGLWVITKAMPLAMPAARGCPIRGRGLPSRPTVSVKKPNGE
jgi:hypothetical protein